MTRGACGEVSLFILVCATIIALTMFLLCRLAGIIISEASFRWHVWKRKRAGRGWPETKWPRK
jgi:hypothetical protein